MSEYEKMLLTVTEVIKLWIKRMSTDYGESPEGILQDIIDKIED
jgi:hypothetical protein